MPELPAEVDNLAHRFTQELRARCGADLISVILYGSAVGPDYIAGTSDLNFLVVLRAVTPQLLSKLVPLAKDWSKRRVSTPLFLDPNQLGHAVQVYPLEFAEMKDNHVLLMGENVLKNTEIERESLRRQCEEELTGKLLNLSRLYIETGHDRRRLETLMAQSVKSFVVVLRGLLRWQSLPPPHEFLEVVNETERVLGLKLESFREIRGLRQGYRHFTRAEAEALFDKYFQDVQTMTNRALQLLAQQRQ